MNIPYTATLEQIKSAFWKMAKLYHPDLGVTDNSEEKFKLIAKAYQVLGNKDLKKNYDQTVMAKQVFVDGGQGYIILPKSRVEYASSLKNLADSGLLAKKLLKRKHRLKNFGYDVSITITLIENKRGVLAKIPLPAKEVCYVCYGTDRLCYLCDGMGQYSYVTDLQILIPPNVKNNIVFDLELKEYRPSRMVHFTMKNLKLLIQVKDLD